jgi:hypothetical protein
LNGIFKREAVSDRISAALSTSLMSGAEAMTYVIHASRGGQSVVTIRINPVAAVDKARLLERLGWRVHITDLAGYQFGPPDFYRLLMVGRETA